MNDSHHAAGKVIRRPLRLREAGFTFAEMAFAFLIIVVVSMALMNHMSLIYRRNAIEKDKVFAYSKASAILAELQSYVNRTEDAAANSLDIFDDGASHNLTLTIAEDSGGPVAPDHPLSGNTKRMEEWAWSRRITVKPFSGLNNRNVRYVTVRVYKRRAKGGEDWEILADLSGVVNSVGSSYPTTQEYDVYLLALENIPGWWVHMDAIRPFVESTITDLESRNPGVKFRTHWITKSSYGRNQQYTPWVNYASDSTASIQGVYFYPGTMPSGSASTYYYVPENIHARYWMDGTLVNGYDAVDNAHPYALADKFNHAMRLPEERELFERRVAAGLEDESTPTWRLLLEDMITDSAKFHNAILVNLHGELLPMPAMRNYSDPARSPVDIPNLRVVTHPEQLRFDRGVDAVSSEDVVLRVYAYWTDPSATAENFTDGKPIVLQLMNMDLTKEINGAAGTTTLKIESLRGGVDIGDGDFRYYPFANASTAPSQPREMYYECKYVDETATGGERYTLIYLHNTPTITPTYGTSPNLQGLDASRRLYGQEYIPCSCESANDFSQDLASELSSHLPRNTARWRITIPKVALDGASHTTGLVEGQDYRLEVRTRIDTDLETGASYPVVKEPENLSKTYVWWVADPESVPFTERAQFIGDPRHCPYADLKHGTGDYSDGYNWYHDNFDYGGNAQSLWPGFDGGRIRDRWEGRIEIDYPRFAQVIRHALVESEAIYTTLTGWSYYYIGIGNEIGYDSSNGYSSSIPVNLEPYGSSGWSYIDNISGGGNSAYRYQKVIREGGGQPWWGLHWLGELYPDSAHGTWEAFGNLKSGNSAGTFYRDQRYDVTANLPYGTRLYNAYRRTAAEGCTSIFNIGSSSSTFHHRSRDGQTGYLENAGLELAANYNFPLPTTTKISRPFSIAASFTGGVGDEWNYTAQYPRFSASVEQTYYRHSDGSLGSALIGLTNPAGNKTGHIVVSGLDRTVESGSSFIPSSRCLLYCTVSSRPATRRSPTGSRCRLDCRSLRRRRSRSSTIRLRST
jgi:hypothetical protein